MCVLSDRDIEAMVRSGLLISSDYSPSCLTPNGYDLRISRISVQGGNDVDSAAVQPGQWFAISTLETVKLPGNVSGQLWVRSTYARKGIITSFGKVDAGFSGTLTLTGYNASLSPVTLSAGERFAQLVFERLSSMPSAGYAEKSGNYQGQKGITLKPLNGKE